MAMAITIYISISIDTTISSFTNVSSHYILQKYWNVNFFQLEDFWKNSIGKYLKTNYKERAKVGNTGLATHQ